METTIRKNPIDWWKLSSVCLVHAITLLGIILWLKKVPVIQFTWRSVVFTDVWFVLSCTSVTAGYHRLFSHPTYRATTLLKIFLLLLAAAAFQGSAYQWSALHRDHHKFVDKNGDPYRIWRGWRGFLHAHIGWVVRKTYPNFNRVKDLARNPLILWQHRLDVPLGVTMTFVLPAMIGMLWGEALGSLFLAGFVRLVIQWHMTFSVNSIAHCWGERKYSDKGTARGTGFLIALLTWGEGQSHERHHAVQIDYRTGIRWWDFDPAKWAIWTWSKVGLASNLRRVRFTND